MTEKIEQYVGGKLRTVAIVRTPDDEEEHVKIHPSINTLLDNIGVELDRAEKHLAALHDAVDPFLRPWEISEKEHASLRESGKSQVAEQLEVILGRVSGLANRSMLIHEHIDWQT